MTNNATLAAFADFVSLAGGKNYLPDHVAETLLILGRDDSLSIAVSGTYSGVQMQLIGRKPDGTDSTIGVALSPANNATTTFNVSIAPGLYGDVRAKLLGIAAGSIFVSVNSSKSGTNAAPGAAAAQWPPLSPVGR